MLPLAVDRDCVVAARPRDDGRVTVRSVELAGEVDVAADGSDEPAAVEPAWGRYVAGVVRALAGAGRAPVGVDAALSSTVPVGSGLSSSAALEVAIALALTDAAGFALPATELARACQRGEHLGTWRAERRDGPAGRAARSGRPRPAHRLPDAGRRADRAPGRAGGARGALGAPAHACGQCVRRTARGRRTRRRRGSAYLRFATRRSTRCATSREPATSSPRTNGSWSSPTRSAPATPPGSARCCSRVTPACATTTRSRRPSSTSRSTCSSSTGRSAPASPAPGSVAASSRWSHTRDVAAVASRTVARYRAETGLDAEAFEVRAVDGAGPLTAPVGA